MGVTDRRTQCIRVQEIMADNLSPTQRSALMSRVRSADTRPEVEVRSALHRAGFRFRLHDKNLVGKPDIVLRKHKTAIFVHGCFWHGHDCSKGRLPKTNAQFWKEKISKNHQRDRRNIEVLQAAGWRVFVIWECNIDRDVDRVINALSTKKAPNRLYAVASRTNQE